MMIPVAIVSKVEYEILTPRSRRVYTIASRANSTGRYCGRMKSTAHLMPRKRVRRRMLKGRSLRRNRMERYEAERIWIQMTKRREGHEWWTSGEEDRE